MQSLQQTLQGIKTILDICQLEYEGVDWSKVQDISRLINARQFFVARKAFVGQEKAKRQRDVSLLERKLEVTYATIYLFYREERTETGRAKYTEQDAKYHARVHGDYEEAYKWLSEAKYEYEILNSEYYTIQDQIDVIAQAISYIKQELSDTKFMKQ
jgi:hypothetical protein